MKVIRLLLLLLPLTLSDESNCENGVCLNSGAELYVERRERPHPLVRLMNMRTTAMAAKFRSLSGRNLDVWYDDGREGIEQAKLKPGMISTLNTYEGHSFYVTPEGRKNEVLSRFTISKDKVFYSIEDAEVPGDELVIAHAKREEEFIAECVNKTGVPWRHYFGSDGPRAPPTLYMWPATQVGDVHRVMSTQGYWQCNGTKAECQDNTKPLTFELEVVSLQPKAFIIENFISAYEADEIMKYSNPTLHKSTVGNKDAGGTRASTTRTSSNTWISRTASELFDSLYRRAADVLQIDESILYSTKNAEDIQVVHYINGEKYDSHHDWGVASYPESRFLTLLLYLTDMPSETAGGETAFPKGNDGLGFKVQPKKGNAVLFYSLLEDGNGDDLSLHAALPAVEGEKWLANFWVWDPKRRTE